MPNYIDLKNDLPPILTVSNRADEYDDEVIESSKKESHQGWLSRSRKPRNLPLVGERFGRKKLENQIYDISLL